jgi:hypothetical protein
MANLYSNLIAYQIANPITDLIAYQIANPITDLITNIDTKDSPYSKTMVFAEA